MFKKIIPHRKNLIIITFLVLLNSALLYIFLAKNGTASKNYNHDYSELAYLSGTTMSFEQLSEYFEDLGKEKGGEYAFEILKQAHLPENTDLHLLGHVVGNVLYEERGLEGIKLCTQDFRNACSHSIVVGAFIEYGEQIIPEVKKICHEAPGGKGAYTMCFHGFGHGVLAYAGYNLDKAVELCKKVGTPEYGHNEYIECVGGTIMEMTAGVHDRDAWLSQVGNYMPEENPLGPCNTDTIPDEAKGICYTYLTPRLFQLAGADINSPEPNLFAQAFKFCNEIPLDQVASRENCFGGFGKEFTVLANNRYINNMGDMTEEQLTTVYSWCKDAQVTEGIESCARHALNSLFWGGENDPKASVIFCKISGPEYQNKCYEELINSIKYFITENPRRQNVCDMLPLSYISDCKSLL